MILHVVMRLASAFRVPNDRVQILLRDLNRRLDASMNVYNIDKDKNIDDKEQDAPSDNGQKVQNVISRLVSGDTDTIRRALLALIPELSENESPDIISHENVQAAVKMALNNQSSN